MVSFDSPQLFYLFLFALSGVVSLVFAYYISSRYDARGTKTLAYSFGGVGLWALNSAARTATGDPTLTHLLLSTEMFLTVATARVWFIFAAQYTNREIHRKRPIQLALYVVVAAAFIVPLTNPLHGLMWKSVTPIPEPFIHFKIAKGPAHYVLATSGYALVGAGLSFLIRQLRSTSHTNAIFSLIVGSILLVSANAMPYLIDTVVTHSTTITPLGATMFCLFCAIAIRHNLFAVTPVARERVFTAIVDPVVMLDRNERIIDHNPAFAAAFTSGQDVSHEPFPEMCPDLAASIDDSLNGPEHVAVPDTTGVEKTFTVTASPLQSGPHTLGRVLVFRDITDILTSQEELARKDSQLDEFTDSVAHDLRNPLAVIVAHTDLLRTHLESVDSGEADYDHHLAINTLDQFDKHSNRISTIIDDFLSVTKAAKSLGEVEPIDFEEIIKECAADHIAEDSVTVPTSGKVYASSPHLRLLLDSIFRNTAFRVDGQVKVTALLTDDGFIIEDTAQPIPYDEMERVLEYGHTTRFRGKGLGLSVAKTIAEAHHWSISLDPNSTKGVRVTLTGATTTVESDSAHGLPHPPA